MTSPPQHRGRMHLAAKVIDSFPVGAIAWSRLSRNLPLPVVPKSMESVKFHQKIMPVSAPPNRSFAGPIVDSPSGTSRLYAGVGLA